VTGFEVDNNSVLLGHWGNCF